jgi:hypothetical protein
LDQDSEIQIAALMGEGCTTIRSEKRSRTTTEGREELRTVLDFLREGDVLMVTRIDRLSHSVGDLQDIVRAVRARGASLKATEQPIDTSTAAGKCFLDCSGCSPSSRPTCARAPARDMPSRPIAQAWRNISSAPASVCSVFRLPFEQ